MDPNLRKRPARKQVSEMSYYEDHPTDGQDYNIWYHKRPGFRREKWEDRENPGTRCNILTDAGKTKAAKGSPFCIYFAHGRCALGSECTFLHRIPTPEDEARLDLAHDIFGRERFSTDREDMGGVGSFSRENRTLYIGGLKNLRGVDALEQSVRKHFQEWGPIEYVRVIITKSIAFVRYQMRASAEFAKEAMNNQSLDNNEVLNVRWATEDCNPIARLYEERNLHREATTAVNKRLKLMNAAEHNTMHYELTGEYPETDSQFASNPDPSTYEYQYSYPYSDYKEAHPYAVMNAAKANSNSNTQVSGIGGAYPYGYYGYEYAGYPAYGNYIAHGEFVPAYKTAERELAEQEQEQEQDGNGDVQQSAPLNQQQQLPLYDEDTSAALQDKDAVVDGTGAQQLNEPQGDQHQYESTQEQPETGDNDDPLYNNRPLQFSNNAKR
jgi:hypothetical protein